MINVSDQLLKESKEKPGLLCNSKSLLLQMGQTFRLKKKTFTWMETESWIQQTAAVSL